MKYTYKSVKEYIEGFGYKLLSTEYKNNHSKLKIQCDENHVYWASFKSFKINGSRCPICNNQKRIGKTKLNYDEVKEYIESFGYKLLSTEYKGGSKKIKVECPKSHIYDVTFESFKTQNHRCSICRGNKKYSYAFVKDYIEKNKIKLLSKEYKNVFVGLKMQCDKKHVFYRTFKNLKKNKNCPVCKRNNLKLKFEDVKKVIEIEGHILLSNEYNNSRDKLKILCPNGHVFKMDIWHFRNGHRCKKCDNIERSLTYKEVKKYIKSFDYELISKEYQQCMKKLKVKCTKGHEYTTTFNNFRIGNRCPICNSQNKSSKAEKEIQQYTKQFGFNQINNEWNIIKNPGTNCKMELDIYFPDENKAIEYDGEYWHSLNESLIRDNIKDIQCKKLGIKLLRIKEKDWNKNKNKEVKKIREFLGVKQKVSF